MPRLAHKTAGEAQLTVKPRQTTPDPRWENRNGGAHDDSLRWAIYNLEQQIGRLEASFDALADELSSKTDEAAEQVEELRDWLKETFPPEVVRDLALALRKAAE